MVSLNNKQILIYGSLAAGLAFSTMFYFAKIYQSPTKTMEFYSQALEDYNNGKFQNSYYLFSRVSFFSDLKPIAIYRQAKSAEAIDDNKAAIKQYQLLFSNYPHHRLSLRAKYHAARLLVNEDSHLAKKYFNSIIDTSPNTDYGIASEYFLGKLLLNKYDDETEISDSDKIIIKDYYLTYLRKAPSGRWAINILRDLTSNDFKLTSDDYLLLVNAAYNFADYDKARELLFHIPLAKSWALDTKVAYAEKNYSRVRYLTEYGVLNHSTDVNQKDFRDAVELYLKVQPSNYNAASKLYSYNPESGKDFILNQKCRYSPSKDQRSCFEGLYKNYPNSEFAEEALVSIFLSQIKFKQFSSAEQTGLQYLKKYNSYHYKPMVMYWMGKLAERTNDSDSVLKYYRGVITKYPDNYYSYRAYLRLNNMHNPIISSYINEQPVLYPYDENKLNKQLAELKDYDMLFELNDDDFIKSWIYYQKGDYSHSMLVARDAMEKIEDKPDKYDLRWRLVYPIDFYDLIIKYADKVGNNPPLILSLVREESFFNPNAKSAVGASGLMQLMPATAAEVARHNGIQMKTSDLFDPELNIKLGNYYYSQLKSSLSGLDISSIAAYNGGIGSVNTWKKSLLYNDTDEFVEQIPYRETRDYVKKVFRSYWNYVRIYTIQ